MRPIRLELENFTVYRGKHSIDFSPLSFFVIKGRTGAGKSSIIDAICYALYGRVPRYGGEKAHKHLLSRGQSSMYVSLEFSVRGNYYRVDRAYSQSKSVGQSTYRFYENGKPIPLRESELNERIKEILRLDYETFTKVILLPQNQFDRFLKPEDEKERRKILNSLLGFSGLFDAIKERIKEEYRALEHSISAKNERLIQLSQADENAITKLEGDIRSLEGQYGELKNKKTELQKLLEICKRRDDLEQERLEIEERLRDLSEAENEVEEKKKRLKLAVELLPYKPRIEEYERIKGQEEGYIRERQKKERDYSLYSDELKVVEEEFKKIEEEFKRLEEYNKKILKLNNVLQMVESYKETEREREELKGRLEKIEEGLVKVKKEEEDCKERLSKGENLTKEVQEKIKDYEEKGVEEKIKSIGELKEKLKRLEDLEREKRKVLEEINKERKELEVKERALEEKDKERQGLEERIREFQEELENLRLSLQEEVSLVSQRMDMESMLRKAIEMEGLRGEGRRLEDKLRDVEGVLKGLEEELFELENRRLEIYAMELRASLKEGDVCPVCGGVVGHVHEVSLKEDLQSLLNRLKELQDKKSYYERERASLEAQLNLLKEKERTLIEELKGHDRQSMEFELSRLKERLEEIEKEKALVQEREREIKELKEREEKVLKDVEGLRVELERIKEGLRHKESRLEQAIKESEGLSSSLPDEPSRVEQYIKDVERDYEELKGLREKERKYLERLKELREELSQKEKRRVELEKEREGLIEQIKEKGERLKRLEEDIKAQIGEAYSHLLEQRVKRAVEDLTRKIKQIQEDYQKVSKYKQDIELKVEGLKSDIRNIENNLLNLKRQKEGVAKELYELYERFGSLEEAEKYMLDQEGIERLRQEVEQYEREKDKLSERREEIEKSLRELEGLPKTEKVEEELSKVEKGIHDNREAYGHLQRSLEELKRLVEERKSIERELQELKQMESLYERLRKDFKDDEFPEYVSQIMLSNIAERGSYYLFKFTSGQFTFEIVDGDLYVMDHHTGHHRPVSSLSGGETFLASLSLAFAVADILSQNAPLESLFIDEGFGSLDRETRESLGEFFEVIKQSTNRMVGIITHVEDIADKFSQRIEVEKKGASATIKVIY